MQSFFPRRRYPPLVPLSDEIIKLEKNLHNAPLVLLPQNGCGITKGLSQFLLLRRVIISVRNL